MGYVTHDEETGALPGGGGSSSRPAYDENGVDLKKQPAPLMAASAPAVAKLNVREWERQEEPMRGRKARWLVNRMRRQGVIGVYAYKPDKDRNEWKVYIPLGARKVPTSLNQAARLCRRLKSNLYADPPTPEATPDTDSDEDRSTAEFTTRVLQVEGSSAGYNNLKSARRAFDAACTYDSGFRHHYIDPKGGGRQPKKIQASPAARTVRDALYTTVNEPDPATGQMRVVRYPQPGPYVTRYVKPAAPVGGAVPGLAPDVGRQAAFDAELTDDASEADYEWLPKVKHEVLTGRNVRLYPETASDVSEAAELRIGQLVSVCELKRRFETVAAMSDENLAKLCRYRPPHPKDVLPPHLKDTAKIGAAQMSEGNPEKLTDDAFAFIVTTYHIVDGEYPNGCYIVTGGDEFILDRREWVGTKPDGVKVPLLIPVDQCKGWEEGEDDPYGYGLMHLLGTGNELRAQQLGAYIEHLERFNRRKVWYPWNSPLSPKEMQAEQGTYLPYNPQIGAPQVEQVPEFPGDAVAMLDRTTSELNSESGLEAPAQGQNPPGVESGYHAQQLIEQVSVGLSDIKQANEDMITRGWLIDAQLIMAFYTVPQRVAYVGDDGEHKEREFTGADLGGFKDIQITKGSFTMLSPSAKMAIAEHMMSTSIISPQEGRRIILGNVGGTLGVEDDPAYLRIRRQLSRFLDGPPKDSTPDQWPQIAADIFDRRQTDLLPDAAAMRWAEIARAINGTKYAKQPAAWRQYLDLEGQAMRQGAGITTLAEQQAAQAAQAAPPAPAATEPAPTARGGGKAPLPSPRPPALAITAAPTQPSVGVPAGAGG